MNEGQQQLDEWRVRCLAELASLVERELARFTEMTEAEKLTFLAERDTVLGEGEAMASLSVGPDLEAAFQSARAAWAAAAKRLQEL